MNSAVEIQTTFDSMVFIYVWKYKKRKCIDITELVLLSKPLGQEWVNFSMTLGWRSSSYFNDILLFNLFGYSHIVFTLTNNNKQETAEEQDISAMPTFKLYKRASQVNVECLSVLMYVY